MRYRFAQQQADQAALAAAVAPAYLQALTPLQGEAERAVDAAAVVAYAHLAEFGYSLRVVDGGYQL